MILSPTLLLLVTTTWCSVTLAYEDISVLINTQKGGGNAGIAEEEEFDALTYLERAGYLDDLDIGKHRHHAPDMVKHAIREFQQYAGLVVTGSLDLPTVKMMKRPRCGVADVMKPSMRPKPHTDPNAPENYLVGGSRWYKTNITYKWVKYTNQLTKTQQRGVIAAALNNWSRVSPLNFQESTNWADIEISFVKRDHGDNNPFTGRGGALAHTFYPGNSAIAGDVHFDDDEPWGTKVQTNPYRVNLVNVATHELGHALGLGHSGVRESIMYAFYNPRTTQLHVDDINGIQSLYGPRVAPSEKPQPNVTKDVKCRIKFDAISPVDDKSGIYVFAGENFYLVSQAGLVLKRKISDVYKGAPSSPDAVVYDRLDKRLFFFKGRYYYRYSDTKLDKGYPRQLGRDFQNVQAAVMRFDSRFYLFKNGEETKWLEGMTRYPPGYPRSITDYYGSGSPSNVDAAFEMKGGLTYLFKDDKYWKYVAYRGERLSPGYPKSILPFWLHCGYVPGRDDEPLFGYVG